MGGTRRCGMSPPLHELAHKSANAKEVIVVLDGLT